MSADAMQSTTDAGDDDGLELERGGHRLTYLGQDGEGWHHHHDADAERVLVVDDQGQDVERGVVIYRQIDADTVDHIEAGVTTDTLERWMAYVAGERGWDDRALTQIDTTTIWGIVERALDADGEDQR
jgi:hypothetical protein